MGVGRHSGRFSLLTSVVTTIVALLAALTLGAQEAKAQEAKAQEAKAQEAKAQEAKAQNGPPNLDLEWTRLGDSASTIGQENGTASIEAAEFSPDGNFIVSGAKRGGDVVLWDSEGNEIWRRYHANRAEVEVVAFTKDGDYAVTGGEDAFIRVWRVSDGQQVKNVSLGGSGNQVSFDGMRFSNDGDLLAGGDERGQLVVLDTSDPNPANWPDEPVAVVFHNTDEDREGGGGGDADINSVDWTEDDRFIVTGGRDGTAKRWEVDDLNDPDQGLRQTYTGFQGSVKSVRISPNGRYVAAGGARSPDGQVLVWDYDTARVVESIEYPTFPKIEAVEWTPNGDYLLTGSIEGVDFSDDCEGTCDIGDRYPTNDGFGNIRAYDANDGFALTLEQLTFRQEYLHFDSDGNQLVSSHGDGALRLWDVSYQADPGGPAFPESGVSYGLQNVATGEYLDTGPNGNVDTDPGCCSTGQNWRLVEDSPDVYYIVNQKSGRGALDTSSSGEIRWMTSETPGGTSQMWRVEPAGDGTYRFLSERPGRDYLFEADNGSIQWNTGATGPETR